MGWSCSSAANDVLKLWTTACLEQTGSQNTFKVKDATFFFEVSRKEHDDGSITGTIMKMFPKGPSDVPDSFFCRRNGSFRINGDGAVERAPKFLKDVVANPPRARLV